MEPPRRLTLGYSLKNIPIPPTSEYMKVLIEKTNSVIRRMRWRAHHYLRKGKEDDEEDSDYYGFKSRRSPPNIEELKNFEDDLASMIENVTFRMTQSKFHDTLRKDITRINRSQSVFVPADKTRNLYEVDKDQYNKLLTENITKHYRIADESAYDDINVEAQKIARKLKPDLDTRMEPIAKREAYITLKDHKEHFAEKLQCRLINPTKSEMGMVSKRILDKINNKLKGNANVTLWRSSTEVIDWFKSIKDKKSCTFVCFDIVEFYPSISQDLLEKALKWAQQFVQLTEEEVSAINNSRKSLLFNGGKSWMKKTDGGLFDVTMGSYDGAEVCELVGMFTLAQLPDKYKKNNVGLYRDDGLGVFRGLSGSEADRVRKDIIATFKALGLQITIASNVRIVNYLDLTLNLSNGKHYPYRKPSDTPLYINKQSNHPPAIINSLPSAIARRLTHISHDKEVFEEAAPLYNEALKSSGYTEDITYVEDRKAQKLVQPRRANRRQRKITWFNPPYGKNVKTKIAEKFLRLIDTHFPKGSKLHQIFNRNTVKVSYSCMPNVAAIIKRHNSNVCNPASSEDDRHCNCRGGKSQCPLSGECLAKSIVYEASVSSEGNRIMKYIGSTATTFKERYNNHKVSFNNEDKSSQTELSKFVWRLKRQNARFKIDWKIRKRAQAYNNRTKRCNLCLTEKLLIATADKASLLNRRSELASKCRHENKFFLSNSARAPT